ncbi:MAG: superoxide dismutase [Candidatus Phytoplasma pyri]|uniref:superoxide dismutase n=1 Tax=Candidatus Phytoplasma pyri TaxID=47566 RepID=UPI003983B9C9
MSNFKLPKLSYNYDALEPFFDAKTMEIHYTKHHQTYVDNLNQAVKNYPNLDYSLEEMLTDLNLVPTAIRTVVQNHGGGHFNHSFFWQILKLNYQKTPQNELANLINHHFGSLENFKNEFSTAGKKLFGSGWVWLLLTSEQKLIITTTVNQNTPLHLGTPLLGLDLWEHAYYLSFQNRRPDYIEAFFSVINWSQVEHNLMAVLKK